MNTPNHVLSRTLGPETIVVDLADRRAYGLNPAGALVWSMLPDGDIADIAAALAERFGISTERAGRDARSFLSELEARGLTAVDPPADRRSP